MMVQRQQQSRQPATRTAAKPNHWSPVWVAVAVDLASVAAVLAEQLHLLPIAWWVLPGLAAFAAVMLALITAAQAATSAAESGWGRVYLHRMLVCLTAGGWTTWAIVTGWTQWVWLCLSGGTMALLGLTYVCQPPKGELVSHGDDTPPDRDRRPEVIRRWEGLLRHLTRGPVTVTAVKPWDNPADGVRIYVDLPLGGEVDVDGVNGVKQAVAQALRLPPGCTVRVLDGDHQGAVVLDVMLRDCLADEVMVVEDFTPASVYDSFEIATTPRGEPLDVCMRSQAMVIGGAPDSGKTTLLHRIILFLARCVDALIWVVDTNGGGVATPWVRPWALGKAARPIVDWVAADEDEAAVLVAVAAAIAKDRKTSPEATRRKFGTDNAVLPVDAKLPAIVVLNDEGAEIRQAVSLLGQLADQGISRVAQIGRAEGVRAIKSVLRGTSDAVDKFLRVCAGLRICLRMEEDGEYVHVLGQEPGRTALLHKGTGYVRRPGDPRPIFARTVNVALSAIERAAVACADLRPELDERGQRVAAKVRVIDVMGGREPSPEIAALPVMRDVAAGRAYAGRWDRFAARLAAMRGEELPEPDDALPQGDRPAKPAQAAPPADPALANLLAAAGMTPPTSQGGHTADDFGDQYSPRDRAKMAALANALEDAGCDLSTVGYLGARPVDLSDQASVDAVAQKLLAGIDWNPDELTQPSTAATSMTIREHVLAILNEEYPGALTPAQIGLRLQERGVEANRTYLQDVLKRLRESGEVVGQSGTYSARPK